MDEIEGIKAKINGILSTAALKLTAKEREKRPSADFGRDYNEARNLVEQLSPDLVKFLPPKVNVDFVEDECNVCEQRLFEIFGWATTLRDLVLRFHDEQREKAGLNRPRRW